MKSKKDKYPSKDKRNSPLERGRGCVYWKKEAFQLKYEHTPNPSREGNNVPIEVILLY